MNHDVVIIGAGPAGLGFARSIAHLGLRIAVIEKQDENALAAPEFDGRDIALTHLSVRILRDLGVWARFSDKERPPIRKARVLDGGSPCSLDFATGKNSLDALGYIVSNHLIRKALYEEIKPIANIELFTERALTAVRAGAESASVSLSDGRRLRTSLLVAADSRFSETRRMAGIPASMLDFGRICIVCRMQHERPHHGIAIESPAIGTAASPAADLNGLWMFPPSLAAHCIHAVSGACGGAGSLNNGRLQGNSRESSACAKPFFRPSGRYVWLLPF